MEKVPFFTFTNIKKTIYDSFLTSLIGKSGVVRFFGGAKKNPSKSTSSSPKRSRVDSIELTPPADTTCGNPVPPICHVVFFGGGCLGGMQGSSAYFVWALAPYYKKKGRYFYIYYLYVCSFIFIFGYLCILFIPMKVQPAIFVLDIWGWFTNSHLSMKALGSFQRKHNFMVLMDFQDTHTQ